MPEKLLEAVDWLRAQLESVPPEHRTSAVIEIEADGGSGDCYFPTLSVTYKRPLTPAELQAKETARLREMEKRVAQTRKRLTEEEQMLALFGPSPQPPSK